MRVLISMKHALSSNENNDILETRKTGVGDSVVMLSCLSLEFNSSKPIRPHCFVLIAQNEVVEVYNISISTLPNYYFLCIFKCGTS